MFYLTKDDLIVVSFERFIDDSASDHEPILEELEKRGIAYLKSVLGTRYDVEAIFDESEPIRDELIVQILAKWVIFHLFRRNAARKISTEIKEDYESGMKTLNSVATGVIRLSGLPSPSSQSGVPSNTIFGNLTNKNFYI